MKLKKILIAVLIIFLIGSIVYVFSSEEENISDIKIAQGYYDCAVNEKVVPGDAICYSEYYYNADISNDIKGTYLSVNAENISEIKHYMERFEDRFLYDTDKGNKDFSEKLNEGDLFFLDSGCSKELSDNDFKLYYYDIESYTLYYMWRCQ